MKILVAAKRVVDPYVRIRVKTDGSGVDTANLKMSMNPFDEIALEEAIRLKEKGQVVEIVLVTVGSQAAQDILRHGLSLGADRAIHVLGPELLEPLAVAKALKDVVSRENPQLVFLGKQAIDDDCNQTGQMLASLLDWPQATFASQITLSGSETLVVTREVDGGLETLELSLPAVVTVDLRLNTPRLASLPNIMKARQKPIDLLTDITFDTPRLKVLKVVEPPVRKAGIRVQTVDALLQCLRLEAKVIP
jgi:electron transfer flavoprotein beta subunit